MADHGAGDDSCRIPFYVFSDGWVSAGTLIAFIFVSLGIYALRKREGVDLPEAKFKMPGYPVLPAISVVYSIVIFAGLNIDAKLLMIGWFVIGLIIYFAYGIKHSSLNQQLKKVVK